MTLKTKPGPEGSSLIAFAKTICSWYYGGLIHFSGIYMEFLSNFFHMSAFFILKILIFWFWSQCFVFHCNCFLVTLVAVTNLLSLRFCFLIPIGVAAKFQIIMGIIISHKGDNFERVCRYHSAGDENESINNWDDNSNHLAYREPPL